MAKKKRVYQLIDKKKKSSNEKMAKATRTRITNGSASNPVNHHYAPGYLAPIIEHHEPHQSNNGVWFGFPLRKAKATEHPSLNTN